MTRIPRDPWPDATLPLRRDPYRYISRRARGLGTDAFRTRLMGRRAVCLTGPEAAALFYRPDLFRRRGATPGRVREVISGPEGAIQGSDGEAHVHRKRQFLALMEEPAPSDLERRVIQAVEERLPRWRAAGSVELYEEMRAALAEAVCGWAGVPMRGLDADARARQLNAMYQEAASVGPPHRRGLRARAEAQAWIEGALADAREGRGVATDGPLATVARWSGGDGRPLPLHAAASDLLSVLRPTVAVAVYLVHLAHALHRHPGHAEAVAADPAHRRAFVQEVRRLYPFFPMVAAIAAREVPTGGGAIPEGRGVLLDLYGTGRDPRSWEEPDAFRPERFVGWPGDPFVMMPQGGGDHAVNHRCAGEWLTIRLMEAFAELLTARLDYAVLTPEAEPDMSALPALPCGFRVGRVRERAAVA